jgi:hypothetical protein
MKSILRFLPLFLLLLALSACSEKAIYLADKSEITVNDFETLKSQFMEPSKEYTTAPFFVWNGEITKEEITNFMEGFRDAGSRQVFVHPRPGLITEYLSDEWFDLYRFTVEKGKELGMDVWIYDENSYPSGFGGGHVPDRMPESYNQGQGLRMTRVENLPDTASRYFLCLKEEEDGSFSDITGSVDNEMGKKGRYLLFQKTYFPKTPWYGDFSYVDLLYPGVTQKFIEVTMSGYEKIAGTEFGKAIPGTFTDEPHINSPGGIRWTPDLFEVFVERWHYDLRTHLPSLFEETGNWKEVRHNYTQTLLSLFIDRWAKPWYEYCEDKNLKFTGHYWEHEWPVSRQGGDNMAMYAWHHVPAIDMLFNQWNDSTPRAQFGNVRSVKELASIANQTGRQRKLSETYGGSGWELSFTGMKRNGDWEYALGVNLMNQHLTYFTMAGARKYDYPPSFDYHEPWWDNYKYINDHYARLSLALSAGKQDNDILILEPTTTTWMYDSYVKRNTKNGEIGQAFQSFITSLEKAQVEYDLGSEEIIKDLARVSRKKITIGNAEYSRIVIPPMTENLNMETYRLLEKFVAHGGTLIAFSIPTCINGREHEGIKEFFRKRSNKIISAGQMSREQVSSLMENVNMEFSGVKGGDLYHHRRILANGQLLFLVNSGLDENTTGSVRMKGRGAVVLNTLTGEVAGYPFTDQGNEVDISWDLPPAGSLLLFIPDRRNEGIKAMETQENQPAAVVPSSPMIVAADKDNAIMIDFCDIEVGGETSTDVHTFYAADKVYKHYGFKNGNPWNTSVQFKKSTVARDTFGLNTGFTVKYRFSIKGTFDMSGITAVVERPSLWTVLVNGTEVKPESGKWWLDRSFGVFAAGNLLRQGENTIVLKTSPMKVHAEVEPVYLAGDFSVVPAAKGWDIAPPVKNLAAGSWRSQGLPYYSWGVTYSRKFKIDDTRGKWTISLGEWNGTVAELTVNGKKAGIVAFPPYRADISNFIKPGENDISVTVKGSLKNLLGPHHNNPAPGLTSPGSWRNVKTHGPGEGYQMIDYGLFEGFLNCFIHGV